MKWFREFLFFGIGRFIPDKTWVEFMYYLHIHKKLDLNNPQSFNEKLQWLKLYDHKPQYTKMADKYEAKEYVASVIGPGYTIPTIGVWDNFDDIDFNSLPDQFVLKSTHDSGGVVICKDKKTFDIRMAEKSLSTRLKHNYFLVGREWPYKNIKRRIIAEEYMTQTQPDIPAGFQEKSEKASLTDYKVHCFHGVPKIILVCQGRFSDFREDFYTTDWDHISVKRPRTQNADTLLPRPDNLDQLLEISTKLSQGIPFVRVDFYVVDNRVYIGELTFFPNGGIEPFDPPEYDLELGRLLTLPKE